MVAWVSLLIVWLVWGSTYLAIRVGVETIPPLLLAAARNVVAGLIMFPLARGGRQRNVPLAHILKPVSRSLARRVAASP